MRNILLAILIFVTFNVTAQPTLTLQATANPGGTITVSWDATFTSTPRYITISVFHGNQITTNTWTTGIYGYDAVHPSPLELSGSRTITPPPQANSPWFIVVGNVCEYDDLSRPDIYQCMQPPLVLPKMKLIK